MVKMLLTGELRKMFLLGAKSEQLKTLTIPTGFTIFHIFVVHRHSKKDKNDWSQFASRYTKNFVLSGTEQGYFDEVEHSKI